MKKRLVFSLYILNVLLLSSCLNNNKNKTTNSKVFSISPKMKTTSVPGDADDCAIWIHPKNSSLSLIIGNDKKDGGCLYAWDMNGKEVARTQPLPRSVNLDLRCSISLGGKYIDVLVVGTRKDNKIKVFSIDPEKRIFNDITTDNGISTGFSSQVYGLSLYKNPKNNALFVFISCKSDENIRQILLEDDGYGKIKGTFVREFGKEDQVTFVEGMVVDDELGFLYCSDDGHAILKYNADPEMKDDVLVNKFAKKDGITGDREGLCLYKKDNGKGYIILSNQEDNSINVYDRKGNNKFIKNIKTKGSLHSDGIEATSQQILPYFPKGILVAHNEEDTNFVVYDWTDIDRCLEN